MCATKPRDLAAFFFGITDHDLWTPDFLGRMHELLRSGGHLVTYCVNRRVKDALQSCDFEIKCLRGPVGGKREVMRATRSRCGLWMVGN